MASPWLSSDTVAVVTGANRGIGLAIVRLLAEHGLTVVLTARDRTKGQAAVDGILASGLKSVVFHELDVSDSLSVRSLASWLKVEFGGVDIVINNAGVAPENFDEESAKHVLDTNYYGAKNVTASLLPLLKPSAEGARIVNISSRAGLYERLQSESIKRIFREEGNYTEELADSLATKYLQDIKAGRSEAWLPHQCGENILGESKMFLNVYASALAKCFAKSQSQGHQVFVAGMCPGATLTDMMQKGLDNGYTVPKSFRMKTPDEGAETAIWLALLPKEEWHGKSGKLFAERAEYLFGWEKPPFEDMEVKSS